MAIDPDVQILLDAVNERLDSVESFRVVSRPVAVVHADNVTVEGLVITGAGNGVHVQEASNVVIRNCWFMGVDVGVYALDSENVTVEDCLFVDAGRNFVQFDKVAGGQIVDNVGSNQLGKSNAEDLVSVYSSSGTKKKPLLVSGNYFANGGPSFSGSGIMVGDAGGEHIRVEGNTLANPGQVGIGVPGGTDITITGNTVSSVQLGWSNVGIYVWNQTSLPCRNIEISDNTVDWVNSGGIPNPFWDAKNCGATVTGNSWQ